MANNSTMSNGVAQSTLSFLDVLTLDQAANYVQVSVQLVRSEAEKGTILGRLVDGEWRFVREDLIRWLRAKPGPIVRSAVPWSPEHEAEVEAEIAAIYAQRRATGTVGDLQVNEDGE